MKDIGLKTKISISCHISFEILLLCQKMEELCHGIFLFQTELRDVFESKTQ